MFSVLLQLDEIISKSSTYLDKYMLLETAVITHANNEHSAAFVLSTVSTVFC